MLKLNCGSGQRKFGEGWTNIDTNPRWSPDVIADCASMPMFEDGSAEVIVFHHCAEHTTLGGSEAAFREAYRILCPGGSMLVFVPDLNALTRAWLQGRITDYIFCVNLHGAYMDDEADLHKWSFTYQSLREHIGKSAPWKWIERFNKHAIPNAPIADDWWILGIEAVK
jgi:predicted SAM-dependent methyltransferase